MRGTINKTRLTNHRLMLTNPDGREEMLENETLVAEEKGMSRQTIYIRRNLRC